MGAPLFAGTKDGLYSIDDKLEKMLAGHEITALAKQEESWLAILNGQEVWQCGRSINWDPVITLDGLRANCILPSVTGALVGTSEAHIYSLHNGNLDLVEAFEQVPERDTWFTPWGGPPDVRSLTSNVSGTVFANVHVGGVVRSPEETKPWQPTIDIKTDVHQILADHGSGALLAASAKGLKISRNNGETWESKTEGLHGNYLRAVAAAENSVFVTASMGHASNQASVYRKELDSTAPFQRCKYGLPESFPSNIDTYCLAADGSTVVFGTSEGQVFVSRDCGGSWSRAAEDLPPVLCVAIR